MKSRPKKLNVMTPVYFEVIVNKDLKNKLYAGFKISDEEGKIISCSLEDAVALKDWLTKFIVWGKTVK